MSWNYRVFNRKINGRDYFYLKETYYDQSGEPTSWLEDPETGYFESVDQLQEAHEMMLNDIKRYKSNLLTESASGVA